MRQGRCTTKNASFSCVFLSGVYKNAATKSAFELRSEKMQLHQPHLPNTAQRLALQLRFLMFELSFLWVGLRPCFKNATRDPSKFFFFFFKYVLKPHLKNIAIGIPRAVFIGPGYNHVLNVAQSKVYSRFFTKLSYRSQLIGGGKTQLQGDLQLQAIGSRRGLLSCKIGLV